MSDVRQICKQKGHKVRNEKRRGYRKVENSDCVFRAVAVSFVEERQLCRRFFCDYVAAWQEIHSVGLQGLTLSGDLQDRFDCTGKVYL